MPGTYTNPVFPRDFPDPFVIRHRGRYYAFATGAAGDGRYFRILSSRDLVRWEDHGGALEPLDLPGAEQYWAPEVAYAEGRFYLYYAVGRDLDPDHHLRVAVSEHPLGPWRDAGVNLTPHEIFAIDAHPFRDPYDGQWYLFYARDRLSPPFAGTGVAVDRLLSMQELAGEARDVIRPYAAWQVFERKRAVKQGLDWYTVEGPFTVRAGERYVCFYSGGRWENPNYGVGWVVADGPLGPWRDPANEKGPQVLTTLAGRVVGPGHNSVVIGPDLLSQWIVYHGWDPEGTGRYMRIDPLRWDGERPVCDGPSWEPRPAPAGADVTACLDEELPSSEWERRGAWVSEQDGLRASAHAELEWREPLERCILETTARQAAAGGRCGVRVDEVQVTWDGAALRAGPVAVPVPAGFRPEAWHRLSLRKQGGHLAAALDEYPRLELAIPPGAARIALTGAPGAVFSHVALIRLPGE